MEQSLVSQILVAIAFKPAAVTGGENGEDIDSSKFQSLTFVAHVYAWTSITELAIQHTDDVNAGYEDTKDGDVIYPDHLIDIKGEGIFQVGYIGKKKFARIIVKSGSASIAAYAVKGHPDRVPTLGEFAEHQFGEE